MFEGRGKGGFVPGSTEPAKTELCPVPWRMAEPLPLLFLPDEILLQIFQQVKGRDVPRLLSVNCRLNLFCSSVTSTCRFNSTKAIFFLLEGPHETSTFLSKSSPLELCRFAAFDFATRNAPATPSFSGYHSGCSGRVLKSPRFDSFLPSLRATCT